MPGWLHDHLRRARSTQWLVPRTGKGMRYPGRYPRRRARSSGAGAISLFVARDFIHADRDTGGYVC